MSETKILSVKILPGKRNNPPKVVIHSVDTLEDATHATGPRTYDRPPHEDLLNAVGALKFHYVILCDQMNEKAATKSENLEKFHVSGYSIGGKEEDEGIVITGHMKGQYGAVIINSPFNRFTQPDGGYRLIQALESAVDEIDKEVREYLFEGKSAPMMVQGKLDIDEKEEKITNMKILPADPDAQKRVAEADQTNAGEPFDTASADQKQPRQPRKRKPQTPDSPHGGD